MRLRALLLIALVPAAIALAGCSSSDGETVVPVPELDGSAGGDGQPAEAGLEGDADSSVGQDASSDPDVLSEPDSEAGEDGAGPQDAVGDEPLVEDAPVDAAPEAGPDLGLDLGGGLTLFPSHAAPGQSVTLRYGGALAGSSNVHVHYGFNGWNAVAGASLVSQDDGTGNLDFFAEAPMAPATGGAWETAIALPAGVRALHVVLFSQQGTVRTWDNNGGLDYNAGFPVVLHGPVLTWDGTVQPHDGVIVNFHTGWPCAGRIEFGPGGTLSGLVEEPAPGRGHHVKLAGLAAATDYSYRVSCGDRTDPAVRTFRTAGAQSAKFSFLVMGDVQEDGEAGRWKRTADFVMQAHADASFLVLTGDLPWNDKPGAWWTFFDQGRELLGSRAIVPAKGNHDVNLGETAPGKTSLERLLALDATSGSETHYVLRYGTAALLVLDSQFPADFVSGTGAQYAWAAQRLQAQPLSDATWVFASWHVPPYNAGARHWLEQGAYRDMTSLFDGKLDWVFGGHEHLYQRTRPMRFNGVTAPSSAYGRGAGDGIGYVVVPPAAAWPETGLIPSADPKAYYRDRLAYPVVPISTDTAPSENGYVVVAIDGNTFHLETWCVGGPGAPLNPHLIDQVTYTR